MKAHLEQFPRVYELRRRRCSRACLPAVPSRGIQGNQVRRAAAAAAAALVRQVAAGRQAQRMRPRPKL